LRITVVERNEVTLHALGHIQPFLLAGVGGQTGALARMNRIGVDEEFGPHRLTQWALKAVRQGVVEGQRLQCGFSGGDGPVIRHATGKRRRDRNPTSLGVVLHVIHRWVGQDDARLDRSDQRSHPSNEGVGVEDAEIRGDRGMPLEVHDPARSLGFAGPGFGGGFAGQCGTSQVAIGEVAVMNIPPPITQQQQGSSGAEFNVVGMCEDGQDGGHGEIVPSAKGFGQPVPWPIPWISDLILGAQWDETMGV